MHLVLLWAPKPRSWHSFPAATQPSLTTEESLRLFEGSEFTLAQGTETVQRKGTVSCERSKTPICRDSVLRYLKKRNLNHSRFHRDAPSTSKADRCQLLISTFSLPDSRPQLQFCGSSCWYVLVQFLFHSYHWNEEQHRERKNKEAKKMHLF